jgi:large subunit ribosomal protein L4
VHTPHPRSYEQLMPRKMRRAALRSALSVKAAENSIVVLEDLSLSEPKTRLMAQTLTRLVGESSALILLPTKDVNYDLVMRTANNLPEAKTLLANYVNIRDLFGYDKIVMPLAALDVLTAFLG